MWQPHFWQGCRNISLIKSQRWGKPDRVQQLWEKSSQLHSVKVVMMCSKSDRHTLGRWRFSYTNRAALEVRRIIFGQVRLQRALYVWSVNSDSLRKIYGNGIDMFLWTWYVLSCTVNRIQLIRSLFRLHVQCCNKVLMNHFDIRKKTSVWICQVHRLINDSTALEWWNCYRNALLNCKKIYNIAVTPLCYFLITEKCSNKQEKYRQSSETVEIV